jgi:hypothetical protein
VESLGGGGECVHGEGMGQSVRGGAAGGGARINRVARPAAHVTARVPEYYVPKDDRKKGQLVLTDENFVSPRRREFT